VPPQADAGLARQLGVPTFSPPEGVTPLTVTINLPAGAPSGVSILYTTDGTLPTLNSFLYKGPIQVATTTTIHAVVYAPGSPSPESPIATATYQ
jgi:hypothetical protein